MSEAVLCYHGASDTWTHSSAIPPARILRQVDAIRRVRRVHVTFDDAYRSVAGVVRELVGRGVPVTIFVATSFADAGGAPLLVDELADADRNELATLGWDELQELVALGAAIGSHTATHPHLVRLGDDELRNELVSSKQRIEAAVGSCRLLAYPYGEHDRRVRDAARAAGYERAYTLRGPAGDEFAYPRVELTRKDSVPRALVKATPLYNVLGEARGKLGGSAPPRAMD